MTSLLFCCILCTVVHASVGQRHKNHCQNCPTRGEKKKSRHASFLVRLSWMVYYLAFKWALFKSARCLKAPHNMYGNIDFFTHINHKSFIHIHTTMAQHLEQLCVQCLLHTLTAGVGNRTTNILVWKWPALLLIHSHPHPAWRDLFKLGPSKLMTAGGIRISLSRMTFVRREWNT